MIKKFISGLTGLLMMITASAQTPDMCPPPNPEPVEKTTLNIILYIVLPLLLVVIYFLYRKTLKKREKDKKE